jgi:hypothetical protein
MPPRAPLAGLLYCFLALAVAGAALAAMVLLAP